MKSGLSIREKQGFETTRQRTSVAAERRRNKSLMISIGQSAIFFVPPRTLTENEIRVSKDLSDLTRGFELFRVFRTLNTSAVKS